MKKRTAFDERMASRWGVSDRTVLNWRKAGEKQGAPCPMDTENPDVFFEWYRAVMRREPSEKLFKAGKRIAEEAGEGVEIKTAVELDRAPIDVIENALKLLGLSGTLARAIEEEEFSSRAYARSREEGMASPTLRKNWAEAAAMAAAARKQEDAVKVALELLKEWVRREMEPEERKRREALKGEKAGREMREELLETKSLIEWERVWDKGVDRALRGVGREQGAGNRA